MDRVDKAVELQRDLNDLSVARYMAASRRINRAARREWAARIRHLEGKIRRATQ